MGYDDGSQLTEQVRRRPYSVVLFDEIEKAHPEVFNVLLQVLEDGRLTDAKGRTVDFRNTVLIMTSNVGAHAIHRDGSIGFVVERDEAEMHDKMKKKVLDELRRTFRPEFLNRIDEVIVFHALNEEHIAQIIDIMLKDLRLQLDELEVSIEVTEAAKELLVKEGYDRDFGARPLRRAIQRLVENPLADEILKGTFGPGDVVVVDADGTRMKFQKKETEAGVRQ